MNDVVVSIESLTRQYRDADHPAISQLTLQINRGSLFGLLGPNGAGKTTLVTMLCGLMKPDAGIIHVMGMDATKNSQSVRKKIGVATQEIALFPTLTAYENLFYFGKMYGLESAILKTRIEYYLRIFALTAKARKKVQTFSGGMKRRLNLVAALLHEPALLILDEPTSGVDVQSRGIILDFMQ